MLRVEVPGQALHVVMLVVGYGAGAANVYHVGNRMILANGFHRLFTLRKLGIEFAPVVVQRITHPEVELPPQLAELPREYLIETPRPAMMKDFFDDRLICIVKQRGFLKSLQIGWGVNESLVPRASGQA